jgi:hypothetical protein
VAAAVFCGRTNSAALAQIARMKKTANDFRVTNYFGSGECLPE